ncbi:MAG: HD domain-containing protein [Candidatus Omnitrophica bacterium]|nr:HD domain-containing protein [Candidatus Omnitrophota bacterium]
MKPLNKRRSKTKNAESRSALDFFAEAGLLKRVKRSGWWVAGIPDPESVADHCFRCAVIGFYMAHEEGADPYRVLAMTLFNDIHEARINDLHKMGHYYIDFKAAEKRVFKDQVAPLTSKVRLALEDIRGDYDTQKTHEAIIARDADILECLVQAKEYMDHGDKVAVKFLRRAPGFLKTRTAQKLWKALQTWDSTVWWENVVKFER